MSEFDYFWDARPELSHIRAFARSRFASPWAVLGECMALAVCHVSPAFQLPAYVGGNGSLNLLIAVVGKSGAGKGAARAAARDAFRWNYITEVPLGSGEGIAKSFGYRDAKTHELIRTDYRVMFTAPEIDTLRAQLERGGATLSGELRKVYSGETIGFGYSDPTKRVVIPDHEYRACLTAGVQPGRGAVILDDMDTGFAQRWLWLPATDPMAPDTAPGRVRRKDNPVHPKVLGINDDSGTRVMRGCEAAETAIKSARRKALRGETNDMESHALLTRFKVAGSLSLLNGRARVDDSDWDLSEVVMRESDETRDAVAEALRQKSVSEHRKRGYERGIQMEAADSRKDVRLVAKRVTAFLDTKDEQGDSPTAEWKVKNMLDREARKLFDAAIDLLLAEGSIKVDRSVYRGRPATHYQPSEPRLLSLGHLG